MYSRATDIARPDNAAPDQTEVLEHDIAMVMHSFFLDDRLCQTALEMFGLIIVILCCFAGIFVTEHLRARPI